MLRTIAGRMVRSKQDQLGSPRNKQPSRTGKRYLSTRHAPSKKAGIALKQPKANPEGSSPTFFPDRGESQGTHTPPTNFSQPLFVNIEQSRQAFSEATWNRMNLVTPLLMSFQARGIGDFVRESGAGNFNTAVHTLIQATEFCFAPALT